MKSLLLILTLFAFITIDAQKYSLTSGANMSTAAGEQTGKFKNAYGMGIGFEMAAKKKTSLKLFLNMDAGANGIKTMPYEFEFRNTLTKTNIEYTSYVFEITTGVRYIFNESKNLKPYAALSTGMLTYSTDYVIEDPENSDGCHALEAKKIQSDRSFIGKVEAGLRYTSGWKADIGRNISFDIGVGYKRGTAAEYMRFTNGQNREGADYLVKFQSATNEVHEHAIGKFYKTPVNQISLHIGLIFPLTRLHDE